MRGADQLRVHGRIEFELVRADGWVERWAVENVVTAGGKNGIADQLLAAPTLAKPTHMAIGTGTPAANALGAELDRNALASKTRSGAVITFTCTWAAGDGTGTLTEAGIFDAASVGNMWQAASYAAKPKGAADTLSATWTLTIG